MNHVLGENSKYITISNWLDDVSGDRIIKYWRRNCQIAQMIYYGTQCRVINFITLKSLSS
jgi:hypothetical protein